MIGAEVTFVHQQLASPLRLSTGSIEQLTEARAQVTVRLGGYEAVGRSSMYLSDLWAWPDVRLTHEHRDASLRQLCQDIAEHLPVLCGRQPAHPLQLGLHLHGSLCDRGAVADKRPILARAMCASPFDAALHDAAGQVLGASAFDFYAFDTPIPAADLHFTDGACPAIRQILCSQPLSSLPAWRIVSATGDLQTQVISPIHSHGYYCFKLKLMGANPRTDAKRTSEVFRAALDTSTSPIYLTVDTNEANPDAESVLEYLQQLRRLDANAFDALQYLEQPTHRNILKHRFDWSKATQLKPILLDEGLTSLDLLDEACAQGWSGMALKTCKGHSVALVVAAWANRRGCLLSLQDLTNPGYALIHAALFAAHVPTLNGAELNSPQFTHTANSPWLPRLDQLFEPAEGEHRLPLQIPPGLGSTL